MLICHYDRETGEFIDSSEAQESPLELDVFLVPAHATTTPPPAPVAGFKPAWNGCTWEMRLDRRGEVYYLPDGARGVVRDLGETPPPDSTPEMPLEPSRRKALADVDAVAGNARARFITVLPGQDAIYDEKLRQAQHLHHIGGGPLSFIHAEARATGRQPEEVAAGILFARNRWMSVHATAIESARIGAKHAIRGAISVSLINEIVAAAVRELDGIE